MSSTPPRSYCFGYLYMLVCGRYSFVSRVNLYQIAVCLMLVSLGSIVGYGTELRKFLKRVMDRVVYTAGDTSSEIKPSLPPPSVICIESALYDIW